MNTLKIVALPLDITWVDREENVYALSSALRHIPAGTDIVVLPETFDTGTVSDTTVFDSSSVTASANATFDAIRNLAHKYNLAIAGSVVTTNSDGQFCNRGFFIEPSGEETFYDKHHLFSLSPEASQFKAGSDPIPVVRFRGWNIAFAICYDLRFPAWLRNTDYKYDVLILPANWPEKRAYAWEHLLIARAIENQAYVVGANRSGSDDYGTYDNLTYIFDYLGRPVMKRLEPTENVKTAICIAECDQSKLNQFRRSFPIANDADPLTIGQK